MKSPNSGRKKFTGTCYKCNIDKTSRWYHKIDKNGTVCKSCYDKIRLSNPYIRNKRIKEREQWDLNNKYKSFLNTIKQKKSSTNLTEIEYLNLIKNNCYYCNEKLSDFGIRLDRIDNNKQYLKDNVVPCCKKCNVAKNNMKQSEFINLCIKIIQNEFDRRLKCNNFIT